MKPGMAIDLDLCMLVVIGAAFVGFIVAEWLMN